MKMAFPISIAVIPLVKDFDLIKKLEEHFPHKTTYMGTLFPESVDLLVPFLDGTQQFSLSKIPLDHIKEIEDYDLVLLYYKYGEFNSYLLEDIVQQIPEQMRKVLVEIQTGPVVGEIVKYDNEFKPFIRISFKYPTSVYQLFNLLLK